MYKKIFYTIRLISVKILLWVINMVNYKKITEEKCSICDKVYPINDMEKTRCGEYVCFNHSNSEDFDENELNLFVEKLRRR